MWWSYTSMTVLMLIGFLLIFIVLLQRGRGGGLAGAFGGLGGQSAFGTKAGDVFTKITVVLAVIWVVLAGVSGFALRADANKRYTGGDAVVPDKPAVGKTETEAPDTKDKRPADRDPVKSGGNETKTPEKPQPDQPAEPALKKSENTSGEKAGSTNEKNDTNESAADAGIKEKKTD